MVILWDFNGTLIDDIDLTVQINNTVFDGHGYRHTDVETYRKIFTFPVKTYYTRLGVSDEDFDTVANEWAATYARRCGEAGLMAGAAEAVARFKAAGFRQVIISASKQDVLRRQVDSYPELKGQFDAVLGLDNIYAVSKVQVARDYLSRSGLDPAEAVFLGDTCHDAEVAAAIGVRCMLISGGHQCDDVLRTAGVPVLPGLSAAADMLLGGI